MFLSSLFIFWNSLYPQSNHRIVNELADLNEFIIEQMNINNIPGLSACIVLGDSLVWKNNFGFADLENNIPVSDTTLFGVLSIGKSVTAASFMNLWEEGTMGLDQNVNDVLPFTVQNPWVTQNTITPRMLMCHSSSLSDNNFDSFSTIGDATEGLGEFLQNYLSPGIYYSNLNYYNMIPGTQYHYSSTGPGLIGYIVETLSGMNYSNYIYDSIFSPMNMNRSAWFLDDLDTNNLARGYEYVSGEFQPWPYLGHPAYPGIMLRSNAMELSNYLIMLLNNGNYKGIQILESESVDSMTSIQNPSWIGSFGTPGLGLYYREDYGDRVVWGHNGGSVTGYAAQLYLCKDENTGIVFTTNSNQYVDEIVERMFDYAGMIIIPEEATDVHNHGFTAHWNPATLADEYYFSLYEFSIPPIPVPDYEDLNVGSDTSIVITGLESGKGYFYKIRGHNGTEFGPFSSTIVVLTLTVGIGENASSEDQRLRIYPNPVTTIANIQFDISERSDVTISINSISARQVCQVFSGILGPGPHQLNFDCNTFPKGIYIVELQTAKDTFSGKLIIQ
jgi:CubicO group peptidase (beta-lactamase class C family)